MGGKKEGTLKKEEKWKEEVVKKKAVQKALTVDELDENKAW